MSDRVGIYLFVLVRPLTTSSMPRQIVFLNNPQLSFPEIIIPYRASSRFHCGRRVREMRCGSRPGARCRSCRSPEPADEMCHTCGHIAIRATSWSFSGCLMSEFASTIMGQREHLDLCGKMFSRDIEMVLAQRTSTPKRQQDQSFHRILLIRA